MQHQEGQCHGAKQVADKIHKYIVGKRDGEHGKKAAKCYLQGKATHSPPWEGNTTPTHRFVCALQVF